MLAVHIRKSSPCRPYIVFGRKRTCDPLGAYIPHVRSLASRYGYRSVLLVTDSEDVLLNASAAFAPLRVLVRTDAHEAARRATDARLVHEALVQDARRMRAAGSRPARGDGGDGGTLRNNTRGAGGGGGISVGFSEGGISGGGIGSTGSGRSAGHDRSSDFLLNALLMAECDGYVGGHGSGAMPHTLSSIWRHVYMHCAPLRSSPSPTMLLCARPPRSYVGKFSSHLGRMAYSLMSVRGGVDCLRA